jgi:3-dehydroquinate synthase
VFRPPVRPALTGINFSGVFSLFFPVFVRNGFVLSKSIFIMKFSFSEYSSSVFISREIPSIEKISGDLGVESSKFRPLLVADENTREFAAKIAGGAELPLCLLKSGEEHKNWTSVQEILSAACEAGLGRDGIFIGIGGGVIGDLCGFASSIYMRGCRLVLVSTTLLGMVDASVGGKTGFDLFGIKNLAGSFYPAQGVYIPVDCLRTLPAKELKSGMAELLKTAVLAGDDFLDLLADTGAGFLSNPQKFLEGELLYKSIERAVLYKGAVVTEDLRESGKRMLLNLGHTFAHALEAAAGLGKLSHGEAVAWGIVRSCELGLALGITPRGRAEKIKKVIASFDYELSCPHPLADTDTILKAMLSDKKKKNNKITFIVPDEKSARQYACQNETDFKLAEKIINGEYVF